MKNCNLTALLLAFWLPAGTVSAQTYLVQNGEANAGIIVAEDSPRMTVMAALELQYYLEQISGARLPILNGTGDDPSVKIFVGKSRFTDSLGITDQGLRYGAFRMVSGPDWLVLLGRDLDFSPDQVEPWARNHADRPRARAEWDKLTMEIAGRKWRHPFASTFKGWWNPNDYEKIMYARYGADNREIWNPRDLTWSPEYQGPGAGAGFWLQDEGGSLNAVYEYLRSLGARWYMPGPLGEVIPGMKTIPLPDSYRTVKPDFPLRYWNWYNYSGFSYHDVMWGRRTGMNSTYPVLGNMGYAHGLTKVFSRTEMKKAHPEYYALIEGKRDTSHRGYGRACFSSEGLMNETVRFARFMFDHYEQPHVSIWPGDGYRQCECDQCRGKSPSELVWSFVRQVAGELYESHPDRLVSCGAYAQYKPPPVKIDKFTPNVVVIISNERRPGFNDPERWNSYWKDLDSWYDKVAEGNLMRVENNLYSTKWGNWGYDENKQRVPIGFPVIHPHAMARDLGSLKGISTGECCEESQKNMQWHAPGTDHLTLYVQSRFLWDAGQNVDDLLNEYYRLFYGPAAGEMKTAIGFSEDNFEYAEANFWCFTKGPWNRGHCGENMDVSVRNQMLELLEEARATAGETVYGKRIQTIIDELNGSSNNNR